MIAFLARTTHSLAAEARRLWAMDTEATEPMKGTSLRARRTRIEWIRFGVQIGSMFLVLWIGWDFVRWVRGVEAGHPMGERPAGVEGFLPIAALMSFRHLLATGDVHPVHPAGLVIFLAILATGLLLKKAFCSWICPIGTLSEMLADLSHRIFGCYLVPPRWLDVPLRSLKYLLLFFFTWSIFARMTSVDVALFLDAPYNRVADIKMLYFFEHLSSFGWKVIATLVLLSVVIPQFWCRYLCPYGALLGFLSLLSPLKVTREAESCVDCGLCAKACSARLPVDRLGRVTSDECTACLSCVAACPVPRALRIETPAPWRRAVRPAAFATLLLILFLGGIQAAKSAGIWQSSVTDTEYVQRVRELDSPAYFHIPTGAPPRALRR